MIEEISRINSE